MRKRRQPRGFTLIELMIVISIIMILMSVAAPMYSQSIRRAKEAVLRQDLYTLRLAIDQYTQDKLRGPQSLDDLVSAGYLRSVPKDPATGTSETWQVTMEDTLLSIDQTDPGITDVHSGSSETATDGTLYSEW
ncbi:MAG: type II secretion system protein [Acidobacteriales bacterium]|nr:type II secretion system protein [Terriglobales bacterium]